MQVQFSFQFSKYLNLIILLSRCTGYRPILDAFKSFASDKCLPDIEELKICKKDGKQCSSNGRCSSSLQTSSHGPKSNFQWLIPASLSDLLKILSSLPMGTKYRWNFFYFYLNKYSLKYIFQNNFWKHRNRCL